MHGPPSRWNQPPRFACQHLSARAETTGLRALQLAWLGCLRATTAVAHAGNSPRIFRGCDVLDIRRRVKLCTYPWLRNLTASECLNKLAQPAACCCEKKASTHVRYGSRTALCPPQASKSGWDTATPITKGIICTAYSTAKSRTLSLRAAEQGACICPWGVPLRVVQLLTSCTPWPANGLRKGIKKSWYMFKRLKLLDWTRIRASGRIQPNVAFIPMALATAKVSTVPPLKCLTSLSMSGMLSAYLQPVPSA